MHPWAARMKDFIQESDKWLCWVEKNHSSRETEKRSVHWGSSLSISHMWSTVSHSQPSFSSSLPTSVMSSLNFQFFGRNDREWCGCHSTGWPLPPFLHCFPGLPRMLIQASLSSPWTARRYKLPDNPACLQLQSISLWRWRPQHNKVGAQREWDRGSWCEGAGVDGRHN